VAIENISGDYWHIFTMSALIHCQAPFEILTQQVNMVTVIYCNMDIFRSVVICWFYWLFL